MADDARQAHPDLTAADAESLPEDVGFFELLRSLEAEGQRFGRGGGPEREPARLGQGARLTFPTRDIARLERRGDAPPFIATQVLGLLGPEGPMPLHLTRWVMQRLSNRWFAGDRQGATSDTAFLDFCNMLQHRVIALYWRGWADARPEVQLVHGAGGRATAPVRALAGVGLPGTGGGRSEPVRVRHATDLAGEVRGPERLTRFLSDVIGARVELVEFVGIWAEIPRRLQSRLGTADARLGRSAVVGPRVFDRRSRAELRVGPLDLAGFTRLIDDATVRGGLRRALLVAAGHEMEFDLRPVLAGVAVPEPRLGACRLGRTTWIGRRSGADADDLRLTRVVGGALPGTEAAA